MRGVLLGVCLTIAVVVSFCGLVVWAAATEDTAKFHQERPRM